MVSRQEQVSDIAGGAVPVSGERPGALLIWGTASGSADQFRLWHNAEHLPERAGIPGFQRCRRFRSLDRSSEFFTLYELSAASVLDGEAYRQLMRFPSETTKRLLSSPSPGVARTVGDVRFAAESATGGVIAVWRFDTLPPDGAERLRSLCDDVLPAFARHPAIAAVRLFESRAPASGTSEEALKKLGSIVVPRAVIVAEGWSGEEDLARACVSLAGLPPFAGLPGCRLYVMEVTMTGDRRQSC